MNIIDKASNEVCDKWIIGCIPNYYKRLSIDMDSAKMYAKNGQVEAIKYLGCELYFTQALIVGACISGDFDLITIVTPSQYGKSFTMGRVAMLLAHNGTKVRIGGATGQLTEMIMAETRACARTSSALLKAELSGIETDKDKRNKAKISKFKKIEELEQSISQEKLGFPNGGEVACVTLGSTRRDSTSNASMGKGGTYIIDEASLVNERSITETYRSMETKTGLIQDMNIMISNPHKDGEFYKRLIAEDTDRRLIIWMDIGTSIMEQRTTKDKVIKSPWFEKKGELYRYYLCELPDDSDSILGKFDIIDKMLYNKMEYKMYYLGIDSAYSGKDNVECCLSFINEDGRIVVEKIFTLYKGDVWDEIESPNLIKQQLEEIYSKYNIISTSVDIGYGVWIIEYLRSKGRNVRTINFGSGTTDGRKKAGHYSAIYGYNKRAEMYLDLQDFMENHMILVSEEVNDKVKDTLPFICSEVMNNGKIKLIDKSVIKTKIGRSPDELDSLVLSIHGIILDTGEM